MNFNRIQAAEVKLWDFSAYFWNTPRTCISMTKSLKWSCEKLIHAYASIWRCLIHDVIIEIREKACVHVHHLEISTQEWKWKQLSAIIQRIYER